VVVGAVDAVLCGVGSTVGALDGVLVVEVLPQARSVSDRPNRPRRLRTGESRCTNR
jgi:hypothetical protein